MAAGVSPGDSVLTVPNTFIATTEAISQAGAQPEFVDIDERTYNMDPEKLCEFLETKCDLDQLTGRPVSRRTGRMITAVVPVHLYGQTADMDRILELAEAWNLIVVEDACQAHGAEYFSRKDKRWKRAGSMGKAAAFSFYPGKNLGACGEAGAVTTNEPDLAQRIRMLRDHGQAEKYYHDIEGYNGRLDAIQAGILRLKLDHLPAWNSQRRDKAETYRELLRSVDGVTLPVEPSWARAVYHLYVVRVQDRHGLQEGLKAAGIGTGIHYPIPLHLQKAYSTLGYRSGRLPGDRKSRSRDSLVTDVPTAHTSRPRECCPEGEGLFDGREQLLVTSSTTGIFSLARTLAKESTARRSCSSLSGGRGGRRMENASSPDVVFVPRPLVF